MSGPAAVRLPTDLSFQQGRLGLPAAWPVEHWHDHPFLVTWIMCMWGKVGHTDGHNKVMIRPSTAAGGYTLLIPAARTSRNPCGAMLA
jgi:hypothetical protein